MVAKLKTYGKRPGRDLVASFNQLALSPRKDEEAIPRAPLEPISPNPVAQRIRSCTGTENPKTGNATPKTESPRKKPPTTERKSLLLSDLGDNYPDSSLDSQVEYDPNKPITALTGLKYVESEIQSFKDACNHWEENLTITKIAQGSYATILRLQMKASPNVYTVWKLIPLKPKAGKGSRAPDQTIIEDAAAEVKALALMAEIEGFVEFRSARVLQGSMPPLLQNLNTDWHRIHPDDETRIEYPKEQFWLMVEMSDAGTDLETLLNKGFPDGTWLHKGESGAKLTIRQTWDIFWGTAEALARGEALAEFEHRDLHPGNICIFFKPPLSDSSDNSTIDKNTNLEITIIDYTLSRATLSTGEVLSNSMTDDAIFEGSSADPTDDRQYSMYRNMRDLIQSQTAPLNEHKNQWENFVPQTNILWLYHILKYLLDNTESFTDDPICKSFTNPEDRSLAEALARIMHRMDPANLDEWHYQSAGDIVNEEIINNRGSAERSSSVSNSSESSEDSKILARYGHVRRNQFHDEDGER